MKNIFKAALAAIVITAAASTASAQTRGDMAVGAKLAWLTDDGYSPLGLGVKFQYNVLDRLRLEPSFTYFLPKKVLGVSTNAMDVSLNAHWLFRPGHRINLYPLAGAGVRVGRATSQGVSVTNNEFAVNLGGGADFFLTESQFVNAEVKAMLGNTGSMIVSAGYGFLF